ncbi:MAG: FAD:protein FMN transferase [Algoriphagus sp.]|jgi:thiamine biosynthesis lipoprotein|nr:FAD:protein FMN transferase [Algoriphagus sp.]
MNQNARKNLIYSIVLLLLVLVVYFFRSLNISTTDTSNFTNENGLINLSGDFLGQPYLILYHGEQTIEKSSIDSLLALISQKVLLNSPTSDLNRLNQNDTILNPSPEWMQLLKNAQQDHEESLKAWDPSTGPLQAVWSFSASGARLQDSVDVRQVLAKVGLSKIMLTDSLIRKTTLGLSIDFTDYAQGLALDQVSGYFEQKGISNYFLQLGRYTLAEGVNEKQELWKSKLSYPGDSLGLKKEGILALQDKAIASSGDFSTFYTQDSVKKAFQLDPRTGYPVAHGLLAVSVLAPSVKKAGVLSESLMVQGWREAIALDSANAEVEMILVYNEKGKGLQLYVSPELRKFLSFPVQ